MENDNQLGVIAGVVMKISFRNRCRCSAFTLVEALVVIGLIVFLGGGLGLALWPESNGRAVQTSQQTAAALLRSARMEAVLKHTEARLIIHNDASEPDKKLRYLGIIYKSLEEPDGDIWVAPQEGVVLPSGVTFSEELSAPLRTMRITFPRLQAVAGVGESWYFYEFGRDGTAAQDTAGARLVFTSEVSSEGTQTSGLVVHKLGGVSSF